VTFERIMNDAVKTFEAIGVMILIFGVFVALVGCILELARGGTASQVFDDVRSRLGRAILLGLEILVVADIIRTIVVSATLTSALTLGLIVLVRIALSFAIDVEVDGQVPWHRAERVASHTSPDTASGAS
jgi:uncharacterized membrane protein